MVLKSLLPKEMKVKITIVDFSVKSNLSTKKTIRITKRALFYTVLGLMDSHSGALGDFPGFVQLIPESYKSDKSINITGIDKVHLKCGCIFGSIVNGVREPFLYSFALDQPPGQKIYKETTTKIF